MRYTSAVFLVLLAACQPDETVTGYTDGVAVFSLRMMDGKSFTSTASIDLSETGKISGRAPCNQYFTTQTAPYPWINFGPIASTKMACADLEDEAQFFDALTAMTLVEVTGRILILSNGAGREMIFQAP